MIEQIRAVRNPLTIVALFAALAEIAGTVALATVDKSLQSTFIWFVMGFPTLIVCLFFLTLNFNAKVLYAPSDFRDEKHFLDTIRGTYITSAFSGLQLQGQSVREAAQQLELATASTGPGGTDFRQPLIDSANAFFTALNVKTEVLFSTNELESLGFGIVSDEFYLLDFRLPKGKVFKRALTEFTWVIRVREQHPHFELVGRSIESNDADQFATAVFEQMTKLIKVQLS